MTAPTYSLYQRLPGLVLGFHGCDQAVGEDVLAQVKSGLEPSRNRYDWLGSGIYFWENDPLRAWEFAVKGTEKNPADRGYIETPFVIGAVIDLGLCLNLTDRRALEELKRAHAALTTIYATSGLDMPVNKGTNFGARYLDRAVIETVHALRQELEAESPGSFPAYGSVRSPFPEGDHLYDGAGFLAENHIQIAVCNEACIKGYFRPIVD